MMTPQEFAAKCDHEGGFLEAFFGYGLDHHTDLDPTTVPADIWFLMDDIAALAEPIRKVTEWLDARLTEYTDPY